MPGKKMADGPWTTTDRFHACAGRHPCPPSFGVCGRDPASCPQQLGRGRSRLAEGEQPARVGRALWQAGGRLSSSEKPRRAPGLCLPDRNRWSPSTGCCLRPRNAHLAGARVPAVEILRRVWVQQFYRTESEIRWRTEPEGIPSSTLMIGSPYDPQAHYAKKHTTSWVGYQVHLTESCDQNQLHLITHVETTAAPTGDGEVIPLIHETLKDQDLLPDRHLVDTGYVEAELLVESKRDYGVDLYGPARGDQKRQAREAKGFAADQFQVNGGQQQVNCPQGCTSQSWTPAQDRSGNPVIKIKFASSDGRVCPSLRDCTHTSRPRRTITIHPQPEHEALRAARQRQSEPEFVEQYGKRAGIEGTISQGVRAFGLRRARYLGQAKTHLEHILIATSMNLVRIGQWLAGELPAQTRQSRFVALMQPRAA